MRVSDPLHGNIAVATLCAVFGNRGTMLSFAPVSDTRLLGLMDGALVGIVLTSRLYLLRP